MTNSMMLAPSRSPQTSRFYALLSIGSALLMSLAVGGCTPGGPAGGDGKSSTIAQRLDGPTVASPSPSYASSANVTVDFGGLPGNPGDYVVIAPQGAAPADYLTYQYVAGAADGSLDFGPLADGLYVARAFMDNTQTQLAESAPFRVGAAPLAPGSETVSSASSSYANGADVTVDFDNLAGGANDYVVIARQGAAPGEYSTYRYTSGAASGSFNFGPIADGLYVARVFQDSTQLAESGSFRVGAAPLAPGSETVSSASSSYANGADVTVDFDNLAGGANDYVVIARQGAAPGEYSTYRYTSGAASGSFNFGPIADGLYVARVFQDSTQLAESGSFRVGAAPLAPGSETVSSASSSYANGADVTVDFDNLAGGANDYVVIARQGAAPGEYSTYRYTSGAASGSFNFGPIADGLYVARVFQDSTQLAESGSFRVGAAPGIPGMTSESATYVAGASVMLDFSGMPASPGVFIAIAAQGDPVDSYLTYRYTAGAPSGAFDMGGVAAGTYVARAFLDSTATLLTESGPFTVDP